jgi:hypothetical protein
MVEAAPPGPIIVEAAIAIDANVIAGSAVFGASGRYCATFVKTRPAAKVRS